MNNENNDNNIKEKKYFQEHNTNVENSNEKKLNKKEEKIKGAGEDIVKHINKLKEDGIFGGKSKYVQKMKNDHEVQKCIKEMQQMEENYDKKNNMIMGGAIGIVALVVVFVGIKMINTPADKLTGKNTESVKVEQKVEPNNKPTTPQVNPQTQQPVGAINNAVYTNVLGDENRKKALEESVRINENETTGLAAIYISELLRQSGVQVPREVKNTKDLVSSLQNLGWQKITDPKQLQKGDVCFTTDMTNMEGYPSHVYIFMGWAKEGSTDYALVCDNLFAQNNNQPIHKRNIDFETEDAQKMNFFMRKQ